MAFLRAYVAGTSAIRHATVTARLSQRIPALLPLTHRMVSTTTRLHAQAKEVPSHIPHPAAPHQGAAFPGNPYAGGPSALEKAAHLFFFTEIIRGTYYQPGVVAGHKTDAFTSTYRHVDCAGTILPASVHHHVPFRERSALSSFPR